MKIAMITTWRCKCGIASYSENLVNALADLGHEVYVVKIPRFGHKTEDTMRNIVSKIPVDKIDIIHIQHEYGLFQNLDGPFFNLLQTLDKPIITTAHAVGQIHLDAFMAEASNKVIVHNKFCYKRYQFPNGVIIPHGASPLSCPPPPKSQCKNSLGINPKVPIVGYLGYISNYKGLEVLIQAMIDVPKVALLIGGGWHTEEETQYIYKLKSFTLEHLPNRCQWLGFVSNEDMSRVYGAMDILVYPSRFATESGALITALSHRKAVLASSLQAFKEKEKIGALETFKDVKDLTQKIKRLLENPEQIKTLERNAQKFAEETSWHNIAQQHIRLYNKTLKDRNKKQTDKGGK